MGGGRVMGELEVEKNLRDGRWSLALVSMNFCEIIGKGCIEVQFWYALLLNACLR